MNFRDFYSLFFALLVTGSMCTCSGPDKKQLSNRGSQLKNEKAAREAEIKALSRLSALPKNVASPENNPTTPEKVELGKLLFFDPILSGDKDVACATCHHPNNGYAEFLDVSIGVNGFGQGSRRTFKQPNDIPLVKRNAPTIINTAYNGIDIHGKYHPESAPMFWDNRAASLESQSLEPIKAFEEMRGHQFTEIEILDEIVGRLQKIPEYNKRFETVFDEEDPVNIVNLGKALAAFERSIVTNNSRFDQYMRGDKSAISISEKEGFDLFISVGCATCHNGPMLSDYKLHVLGTPENEKLPEPDKAPAGDFAFRTPTLRNLRFTAPYMHNGTMSSLQKVMEFYEDISFGKMRNPDVDKEQFDPLVKEINLSVKEMGPIISFLNTLNDDTFVKDIPESVPSGLPVGGNIH